MPREWPDSGILNVQYRYIDGHHVFTSDDVDGLYVASKDPRKVYDDLTHAIKMLVQLNDGVQIELAPMLNFREFLSGTRRPERQTAPPFAELPPDLGPRQFAVSLAATA